MPYARSRASVRFALLLLPISFAAAQSAQPARIPEVPFVPTTEEGVKAMLKLAGLKNTDVVYDLGCGDGRIVIAAAKDYGAHAVGVDIDPRRIQEAKANAKQAGVENLVRFEENDLFQADIHEASVVTLFLLSSVNQRLRPKLLQDWKPDKEQTIDYTDSSPSFSRRFFLWVIPERK